MKRHEISRSNESTIDNNSESEGIEFAAKTLEDTDEESPETESNEMCLLSVPSVNVTQNNSLDKSENAAHSTFTGRGRNSRADILGLAPRMSSNVTCETLSGHSASSVVRFTEVYPDINKMSFSWQQSLRRFVDKKTDALGVETETLPKGIRLFYEQQDELIKLYEKSCRESTFVNRQESSNTSSKLVTRLSQISFGVNLLLMIAKAVAVAMSNSMSVISSLVDSVVDLISGILIWWTSHAIKTSNIYVYPIGRSRLEPVTIIILSVIMSLASLEVAITSVKQIVGLSESLDDMVNFELQTILIAGSTVVTKFILAVSFYAITRSKGLRSDPVDALIQDHRNDTLSNLVAILCGYLGSKQFAGEVGKKEVAYIDPAGAILIALYIMFSWWQTGIDQLKKVTGYTADPKFLSQITWIALNHSQKILSLDTVRAFHFGANFLVEVDIVLSADTVLSESHNIGESLQQKIEKLDRVERAFVHVDYEVEHRPQEEHLV